MTSNGESRIGGGWGGIVVDRWTHNRETDAESRATLEDRLAAVLDVVLLASDGDHIIVSPRSSRVCFTNMELK